MIKIVEVQPPSFLSNGCYSSADLRNIYADIFCSDGVVGTNSLKVTPTDGTSMTVTVAAGSAWIEGTTLETQGIYHVVNDSPVELTLTDSDTTDGRIDLIIARIYDSDYEGDEDKWSIEVVEGVHSPTPVAPELPTSSLLLATVNIPAGLQGISSSEIIDNRYNAQLCGVSNGPVAIQKFTANGTFNPKQYPSTAVAFVEVYGSGGGGGGAQITGAGQCSAGGGGGGGGYISAWIPIADLGNSVSVTIGAGGAGDSGNNPGAAGKSTSFGSFLTVTGGDGGEAGSASTSNNANSNGGSGGVASSSNAVSLVVDKLSGQKGFIGTVAGTAGTVPSTGYGGACARGGFGGGYGTVDTGQDGTAGSVPGGGGSAGWNRANQGYKTGANGARGQINVTVYN